ncbi:Betaine reductase complex component B subunit beta [Mixta theicola]|nr:Betaine reductase complex component B subunit beta [Mixta theicola]
MKKAVVYINQYFAGIGGESEADQRPLFHDGAHGSAKALQAALKNAGIAHTIVCGDNYMGSSTDAAVAEIMQFLEGVQFDIFLAGPAFQAGRYGSACGTICKAVQEKFNVPAVTSMHEENPGVEMFRKELYIFPGGKSAAKMRDDAATMARFADKLLAGEKPGPAAEEGFYSRGIRHQVYNPDLKPAAERVIDMLLKKTHGQPYQTELPIPPDRRVPIAPAITDLSKAKIALVTSGGIVPVDNPDRIQSASATRWGMYDISAIDNLQSGVYKTIHAGYDPAAADADPDVVVPLDALRAYEKEGRIGAIDSHFYTTVGTGTTEAEAERMAKEMVVHLRNHNVDAVILTST